MLNMSLVRHPVTELTVCSDLYVWVVLAAGSTLDFDTTREHVYCNLKNTRGGSRLTCPKSSSWRPLMMSRSLLCALRWSRVTGLRNTSLILRMYVVSQCWVLSLFQLHACSKVDGTHHTTPNLFIVAEAILMRCTLCLKKHPRYF